MTIYWTPFPNTPFFLRKFVQNTLMNQPRPYVLAETNWKEVKDTNYSVAILPWGATEAHNYHMPYGTDYYEGTFIGAESARKAWEQGEKVIMLPCIPFGINTGQLDVKLCINMNPSTQYAILRDVVDVLKRHNIHKFVILNSHGGNNFKTMIRELSFEFPEVFTCSINWWQIGNAHDYFEEPGDHAGEMETSVMMYIQPELMLPLSEAGDGAAKRYKFKGFKEGWITSQRHWTMVTKDTGVGNPKAATAEKGQQFFEMITTEISDFLVELSNTVLDDLYE